MCMKKRPSITLLTVLLAMVFAAGIGVYSSYIGMKIYQESSDHLLESFSQFQKNGLTPPGGVPYELLAHFYVGGFFSLVAWWLSREQTLPRENLKRYCRQLLALKH